jgi:methyltransferase
MTGGPRGPGPAVETALAVFVIAYAVQRTAELVVSSRNARRLAARGGRLERSDGFGLIVGLHVLLPILLAVEVLGAGVAHPGRAWPAWCVAWTGAQLLRQLSMAQLGDRWTARVWVVPGEPRVTRGVYRWFPHPNYLGVVVELVAGPMMFGAWRTAIAVSVVNAIALARRLRAEERALSRAETESPANGATVSS